MRLMAKCALLAIMIPAGAVAQQHDKATFIEYKPGYYQNSILKGIDEYKQPETKPRQKSFKIDLSGKNLPVNPDDYKKIWHNTPVSQGNTGTCWCFSTTSYFETEVKRITGQEVKLSEMYSVYWQYVERARYFVEHRGAESLGEGSETKAVAQMMKKYGAVPLEAYSGMLPGQKVHTHAEMFDEIEKYLLGVKARNAWNTDEVVATVRSILNHHMGEVPVTFKYNGKDMTPVDYLKNVLKINPDDYVDIMSLMTEEYWTYAEYKVPDNWWHGKDFINIPLDDFMKAVKNSLANGYGVSIGGDVSEAGFESGKQVAVVPGFDIPSEYIDENARAFRFLNNSTTDDHAMHIVGYQEVEGKTWYLIKDSGAGSRNCGQECKSFGYYFFHEDYVKLKMMTATVHKDMAKEIMAKVKVPGK